MFLFTHRKELKQEVKRVPRVRALQGPHQPSLFQNSYLRFLFAHIVFEFLQVVSFSEKRAKEGRPCNQKEDRVDLEQLLCRKLVLSDHEGLAIVSHM